MSHFLARLVERTRGTAARVEPLVTPRFAPTSMVEIASELEAPSPAWSDHQPKVEKGSSSLASVNEQARARKNEPKVLRESDKSSLSRESMAADPEPEQLLVSPTMVPADSKSVVRRPQARDRAALSVKNGFVERESVAALTAKRPGSPTPATTTRRNFERTLAAPNESSEQPPIVRVTIGRIDVRATAPAAPSRKAPTRSEPKLTLDAYLKSRKESTR